MSKVLIDFINDVIDETVEEYDLIYGKTKEEVKNVEEWYKYIFAGISIFTAFIITLIGSSLIDLSIGIIILFIDLVFVILILFLRQRRIRKLHFVYGEYIANIAQKKDHFLKIRKEIHYWEYITEPFPPNVVRNTLNALETIDDAYLLYMIGIYEKLFPLLILDTKKVVFWGLLNYIKSSIYRIRDLKRVSSKPLPFFIQNEINKIIDDNKKYVSHYFMEPNAKASYNVYVNSKDLIDLLHGGVLKFLKKYGYKVFAMYNYALRPYVFLLDENFNVIKIKTKKQSVP